MNASERARHSASEGRRRPTVSRPVALVTAAALALAGLPVPAGAQEGKEPGVIRDAEVEQLLREYAQPVLQAAGVSKQNVHIVVIGDRSFNAFVADGRRIFINAGALMDAKTLTTRADRARVAVALCSPHPEGAFRG